MRLRDDASPSTPVRSGARRSVLRLLGVHRRVAEWQLASVRLAERQVNAGFELYRVGLQAGLRCTEVASEALAGALGEPVQPGTGVPG